RREGSGGQIGAKRGPDSQLAINMSEASVLANDAVDGGEAEPSAFAQFFGGKERLEDTVEGSGGHAEACIGDGNDHVCAGARERLVGAVLGVEGRVAGFYEQRAAVGHGVAGIDAKIHEDLLDLGGVGANER